MLRENNLMKGELKQIAKILMKMQKDKNNGEGIPYLRDIAKHLKKGKVKKAMAMVKDSLPFIMMFPEINRFVHHVIYPIGYLDPETGLLVNEGIGCHWFTKKKETKDVL